MGQTNHGDEQPWTEYYQHQVSYQCVVPEQWPITTTQRTGREAATGNFCVAEVRWVPTGSNPDFELEKVSIFDDAVHE